MLSSLAISLTIGVTNGAIAQGEPSTPAPLELQTMLTAIDTAANQRDVRGVMRFFSRDFTHTDGLNNRTLEQALTAFWERYTRITYQTELNTWQQEGTAIVAETTTTITGTQDLNGREVTLSAVVRSRQRIENAQILNQEILTEQTRLSTGEMPPTIEFMLPEQVVIGRNFTFDAIVQEPLGDRLLLGTAVEEPVQANSYLTATPINLELLSTGGLFKTGRAPALPDDRWISAVIVREDGISVETRRLRVVGR